MKEELIDFNLPRNSRSIITILGVGGGGNNAVNRMFENGIEDVEYAVINTDAQALNMSEIPTRIQIGETLTEGRGAGNRADIGEQAAIENIDDVRQVLSNGTRMAFIVAGMGGGTGTGAAPVISKACREMGILTVAVVTLPFRFEGPLRMRQAAQGIDKLKQHVDALLIIHNEKLREIYGNLTLSTAFGNADNVLMLAVKGIAEIITVHGYINVDFADVLSVMHEGGIAFMGSAEASGHDRAIQAIEKTIHSPLLNNNEINGARKVLLNITSGTDEITVDEVGVITDRIMQEAGGKVNTIWGTCVDERLGDQIRITLVATGFDDDCIPDMLNQPPPEKKTIPLEKKEPAPDPESPATPQPAETPTHLIPLEDLDAVSDPPAEQPVRKAEEPVKKPAPVHTRPAFDPFSEEDERERLKAERLRALNFNNLTNPQQLDELEKTPAFKRRPGAVQKSMFEEAESKSRYTIGGKNPGLRPNNPYLHDAVD